MNKLLVTGRLVRNPEIKQIKNGSLMASFTLAVRRTYKDKETGAYGADFLEFKAFDATANVIDAYFTKGSLIEIEASVSNNNYQKDGKTVYKNDFVANRVNILHQPQTVNDDPPTDF